MRLPLLICGLALLGLAGCSLPPLEPRTPSQALPEAEVQGTRLGQASAHLAQAHPAGHSGSYPLQDPQEAFAARALLARAADRSLDVQYYIWRGDKTGRLMLHELLLAADRGVRVRLLLDDGGTAGLDAELHALDQHPQIEVRLFNPLVLRRPKALGYVTDFHRTQRRMHNKSFTADSRATIIGGRNVGDEYFGATDGVLFADLDLLTIGPVVPEVAADFDRYWNSASAYPVERIVGGGAPLSLEQLRADGTALADSPRAQDYAQAVQRTPFIQQLLREELALTWAPMQLISDDPRKVLAQAEDSGLLISQLARSLGQPRQRLDLVSPYFVPTAVGVEALSALQRQGVQVRILTNALEATDVAIVHAGYAKYRRDLLRAGITLFEMRRSGPARDSEAGSGPHAFGSSGSSLHAKTFALDGERVFVGSFNFDPRSAHLNTELGFLIHGPVLAETVHRHFSTAIPAHAYRLALDGRGRLQWHEAGSAAPLTTEPGSSAWKRALLWLLGLLPIEHLL